MKTKLCNSKRKNSLVVFDLDHTLLRKNCSLFFGIYLFREKVLSFHRMIRLSFLYLRFKLGLISLKNLHESTFQCFFYGLSVALVNEHATKFLSQQLDKLIYHPVFSKLLEAKNEGSYTAIFSSSPNFLVEKVALRLGVDRWSSTIYQKNEEGDFTHITQVMEGPQKAQALELLLKELQIVKANVTAYTDSYLDLPLLYAVGNPVGVNPDRRLKAMCRQNQWPII
ncbi:HAD family phosphatase [Neochlamydia sp. S13]|uniref:HAD family hydrolase n=1 Tax=Neochlamydia sp. S13 TaxID=1353976 RepID=UPI000694BA57